jgi:hypothetical protein
MLEPHGLQARRLRRANILAQHDAQMFVLALEQIGHAFRFPLRAMEKAA